LPYYFAVVLIARITGFARPSVRPSVWFCFVRVWRNQKSRERFAG